MFEINEKVNSLKIKVFSLLSIQEQTNMRVKRERENVCRVLH